MSSLIDKQAVIEVVSKECFELRGVFGRIEDCINELSTVEAIPVEWIKGWIDNIPSNPRYKVIGEIRNISPTKDVAIAVPCVSDMLNDWEKENANGPKSES